MPFSRKALTVGYKQLCSFSSVVLYDTATRSKHRGRFYDADRMITRRKCGSAMTSYVVSYSSCIIARVGLFFPKAHVFCVLNDAFVYNT